MCPTCRHSMNNPSHCPRCNGEEQREYVAERERRAQEKQRQAEEAERQAEEAARKAARKPRHQNKLDKKSKGQKKQ